MDPAGNRSEATREGTVLGKNFTFIGHIFAEGVRHRVSDPLDYFAYSSGCPSGEQERKSADCADFADKEKIRRNLGL